MAGENEPDIQEEDNGEVKSLVLTIGRNAKISTKQYASEDAYVGVKIVVPIVGEMTPDAIKEAYAKVEPAAVALVEHTLAGRIDHINKTNGLTPNFGIAAIDFKNGGK